VISASRLNVFISTNLNSKADKCHFKVSSIAFMSVHALIHPVTLTTAVHKLTLVQDHTNPFRNVLDVTFM